MPVINTFERGDGIREPDGEWLECGRCGRRALATEWAEVLFDVDGLDPRRCQDCWHDEAGVRPKPVARTTSSVPIKVVNGHVLMTPATCNINHGLWSRCPVCDGGISACANCHEYEAGLDRPCGKAEPKSQPGRPKVDYPVVLSVAPKPPVAAVVVRGLASGETAMVGLFASEEAAVRHAREHGGIVVAGGQVVDLR